MLITLTLAVGVLGLFSGCALAASPTAAPASAYEFWNSFGVNTHLFYSNTPYADIGEVAERLEQLGIMHIRDGLAPGRPDEIAALNLLGANGIKADLLVGQPGSDPTSLLYLIKDQLAGAVDAVEGPNEYEDSGSGWQSRLLPFQATLYQDVQAILPGIPVVGASVSGVNLVGSLDVGNIHPYPGGDAPESDIATQIALGQAVSGQAPIWATETGYHDAMNMASGSNQPATTDAAQSIYIPRLFASYFALGIQRTYLYELVNEFSDPTNSQPESDFGLLNYDLTPKPQFFALANLIAAIRDQPDPDPKGLDYTVSDTGTSLQELLLSRSDGSWQLLLWRSQAVNSAGVGPAEADVNLQLPFCSAVTSESPSVSTDVDSLGTNTQFGVDVGADLQVVSIQRASGCGTAVQTNAVVLTTSGSQNSSTPAPPTSVPTSSSAPASNRSMPSQGHAANGQTKARVSDARLWGLASNRVAIMFRVAQSDYRSPAEIRRVRFRLPAGLTFAKLGRGSAVPASAGTVAAAGSTIRITLRRAARSLRIYVRPAAIKETTGVRNRARRGETHMLRVHVTAVGTTLDNAVLSFSTKPPH